MRTIAPRCGDIGDNPREVEFEPFPATEPIKEPTQPAPAPVEPAPEKQPA